MLYDVQLGRDAASIDIAVASDRGCDRLRIYHIDPDSEHGPLIDITADDVPRVFPERWVEPWQLASDADAKFEGLIVDEKERVLYAAQEVVGLWRIPLASTSSSG